MIHWARDPLPPRKDPKPRVFLAGPTPRDPTIVSWRPEMVRRIEAAERAWTVFVPEDRGFKPPFAPESYNAQVNWELDALALSDVILFWIPRELSILPGFTTNVEFGYWLAKNPARVILGHPPGAPKTRYLDRLYWRDMKLEPQLTMDDTWRATDARWRVVGCKVRR